MPRYRMTNRYSAGAHRWRLSDASVIVINAVRVRTVTFYDGCDALASCHHTTGCIKQTAAAKKKKEYLRCVLYDADDAYSA